MIPALPNLLEEFESLSLDDAVYFVLRSEEDLEVAVHYQKKNMPLCWSVWFKLSEEASKQTCSRENLPFVLEAFGLTRANVEKEIAGRLLSQAAFADEFVRNVGDLLGQEALRESIRATQLFMESLKEMVIQTVGPSSRPAAEPKPSGSHSPPARANLRVLKPNKES
jgi:hypothetical protein